MHYFWRGDMPHFSPPLPFQWGRAECRRVLARDLGGPDRGRPRVPGCGSPPTPAAGASSTSAGLSGAPAGAGQWWSPDFRSRRAVDLGRPERGASACRAAVVPRPPQPARRRPRPARAGRQRVPSSVVPDPCGRRAVDLSRPDTLADGGQPGAAHAARRDRRNLKLARRTGRWPAKASTGPRRRRPCPIFTLLLILLTTPS